MFGISLFPLPMQFCFYPNVCISLSFGQSVSLSVTRISQALDVHFKSWWLLSSLTYLNVKHLKEILNMIAYACNSIFLDLNKNITLPHFTLANIIYHLKVPLELCNVSVPDFSILQTLSSFGNLKR